MATTTKTTKKTATKSKGAVAASTKSVSKFAEQLSRDNSSIRDDRAKRISESVADAQDTLIRSIKDRIRKAEGELDSMLDLSSDNQTTSMNVISPSFNADTFVTRINDLKVQISLDNIKLQIALETKEEWF
jgi:hypothetical protein